MEAHEYYKKETGKLYYKEASLELELTDDYINWLERNVVKLFAIPAVVGRSEQLCDNPNCEDGIVDRDYYGHPIYCQVCDSHN